MATGGRRGTLHQLGRLLSYSCTINIVKEGDEEITKGYPGKEEGQIHLKTAVIGIGDEELRTAIEVDLPARPRHARAARVRRPSRACVCRLRW